jgi:hypothetical protein
MVANSSLRTLISILESCGALLPADIRIAIDRQLVTLLLSIISSWYVCMNQFNKDHHVCYQCVNDSINIIVVYQSGILITNTKHGYIWL